MTDSERLDWLERMMTPKDAYCEIYLAGLRNGDADATSFQVESQPEKVPVTIGKSLREAIDAAAAKVNLPVGSDDSASDKFFLWDGSDDKWCALYKIVSQIPSYQSHSSDPAGNVNITLKLEPQQLLNVSAIARAIQNR